MGCSARWRDDRVFAIVQGNLRALTPKGALPEQLRTVYLGSALNFPVPNFYFLAIALSAGQAQKAAALITRMTWAQLGVGANALSAARPLLPFDYGESDFAVFWS